MFEITDKIRKLLELSESPNPHEAALAAEKAQKFMAEHKITMSEVKDFEEKSPIGDAFVTEKLGQLGYMTWKGSLFYSIGDLNEVTVIRWHGKRLRLFGRESDRQVVEYTAAVLIREIERMAFEDYASQGFPNNKHRWTWVQNFGFGATMAVLEKMRNAKTAAVDANPAAGALVRRDSQLVKNYIRDQGIRTRIRITRTNYDGDARAKGYQAGKSINMNPGVRGGGAARQIGETS